MAGKKSSFFDKEVVTFKYQNDSSHDLQKNWKLETRLPKFYYILDFETMIGEMM